ncbi:MAG: hypothetical protein QM811_01970 [Pirellulales bacterium]
MRRRLQFSLLGFLVLVAAIEVGVKVWHGPHHVIERPSQNLEDEFTYYREWDGNKIVDGPRVLRYLTPNGVPQVTHIFFYRQGMKTGHVTELATLSQRELRHSRSTVSGSTRWSRWRLLVSKRRFEPKSIASSKLALRYIVPKRCQSQSRKHDRRVGSRMSPLTHTRRLRKHEVRTAICFT